MMFFKDARFAIRLLFRSPGFALTLLGLLAVGIGAVTAAFSATNAVLLAPLPYERAKDLTMIWVKRPVGSGSPASLPDFFDWKEQGANVFDRLAAVSSTTATLTPEAAAAEQVFIAHVSGDFFPMFSLAAQRGRLIAPEDDVVGGAPIAVVSDNLWRTRLGGDPRVVGKSITLNGRAFAVVGIAPPGFRFASAWSSGVDVWLPLAVARKTYAEERSTRGRAFYLLCMGRRQPGVSLAQAQARLSAIARQQEIAYPGSNANAGVRLDDLQHTITGWHVQHISIIFTAIGLVFLTICANIAGLLLTRGQARRAEMAARAALGATPSRLMAQVLTETVIIFVLGAAGGMIVAHFLVGFIATDSSPATALIPLHVDGVAFAFCAALALVSGLLSGLGPAWALTRVPPQMVLKDTAAAAGVSRWQRVVGSGLVAAQIALSFVLLAGAGLMVQGFFAAAARPSGLVSTQNLVTAHVSVVGDSYAEKEGQRAYFDRLLRAVAAHPGVESVAANGALPMSGSNEDSYVRVEGRPPPNTGGFSDYMTRNLITPGYFKTMGIPVLRGREFVDSDDAAQKPIIIISERVASALFPGEDPLGKRIAWVGPGAKPEGIEWREIVGIVGNVPRYGLLGDTPLEGYLPYAQEPQRGMFLAIRSSRPRALLDELTAIARTVDPSQAIFDRVLMSERVEQSVQGLRDSAIMLGVFAAISLVLATIGIFGMTSYSTSRRTRELGLRMALGSTPERIIGLVLSKSLRFVGIGLGLGLGGAFLVARALSGTTPGVNGPDPTVFGLIGTLLGAAAFFACVIPAWSAVRIPPAVALRHE